MKSARLTINIDNYYNQLVAEIDSCIANLQNTLRSLEDGSYETRAMQPNPNSVIEFALKNTKDPTAIRKKELNNSFKAIVSTFLDFLDNMIAVTNTIDEGIRITKSLSGVDQIQDYVKEHLKVAIQKVAKDRKLNSIDKIDKFQGLSEFSKESAIGYVSLRNSIEHHKGIANRCIELKFKRFKMFADGDEITSLPLVVPAGGEIYVRFGVESRCIIKGQEIEFEEQELTDIALTIKLNIAPEIQKSLGS